MPRASPVAVMMAALLTAALMMALAVAEAEAQVRPADLADASLEELMNIRVTTATRITETLADAPARMQVITADQIRRRAYRSLSDVLKDLPDFKVDIAADQDYPTQLTVQGTRGTSRLIILLDGIRVSSPTNEPLPIVANYPVHAAQQIEIVYGPASAIYGADAFSGVINIITRNGADAPGLAVGTSIGQDGLYNQTASFGRRIGSGGSLMLAAQFQYDRQPDLSKVYPEDFGGLQGQRTGTFNTIYGPMTAPGPISPDYEIPLSAHAVQAAFQLGGVRLGFFGNRARVSTSPAYTPDNAVYTDAVYNDNRMQVGFGSYTHAFGPVTSTSMLTFSRHELRPDSGYLNVFSNMKRSYKYAYGSMLKAEEQLTWKPGRQAVVTMGASFERFFAIPQGADLNGPIESRDRPGTILDTNIPDEFNQLHYSNTGVYAQVQYPVTPRLALTLGARGDHNTRYGSTFNPRTGLIAKPTGRTTLKLLYGTAFLAPSPYEAYSHYGSFYSTDGGQTYASDYWHLPNPALKPEKKKTIEVNLIQALGGSFAASGSAFYARFTDLRRESDPDQAYTGFYLGWPVAYIDFAVNHGAASAYGSTMALDFARAFTADLHVMARAAVSLSDGSVSELEPGDLTRDVQAGALAPVQMRLTADVDWGRWSIAPRFGIAGRQRALATEIVGRDIVRRTLDGYATLDVNVRRQRVLRAVDVFLTIENALNARYRHVNARVYLNPEELIGAPQNPRRVTIGVDIRVP